MLLIVTFLISNVYLPKQLKAQAINEFIRSDSEISINDVTSAVLEEIMTTIPKRQIALKQTLEIGLGEQSKLKAA
jgi:hypothetical protein